MYPRRFAETLRHHAAGFARSTPGSTTAVLVAAAILMATGCSTPARRDAARQQMAAEIRNLEDQLYEADYVNRVLRDELELCETQCGRPGDVVPGRPGPPTLGGETSSDPYRSEFRKSEASSANAFDAENFDPAYFDPSDIVIGDVAPGAIGDVAPGVIGAEDPDTLIDPFADEAPTQPMDSIPPSGQSRGIERPDDRNDIFPPPNLNIPVPPGAEDLRSVPEIPGDVLPPPKLPGADDAPAGQIRVPELTRRRSDEDRVPVGIRFGRASRLDSDLIVEIEPLDDSGLPVSASDYDIDASLTIIVVDPGGPADNNRSDDIELGRWDFDPIQTASLIAQDGLSAAVIRVPLQFNELRPRGESVRVHARLQNSHTSMRCQGIVAASTPPPTGDAASAEVASTWTPRADRRGANESKPEPEFESEPESENVDDPSGDD